MEEKSTLKTVRDLTLIGAGVVLSVIGIRKVLKSNPEVVNKTGDFIGHVIGGIADATSKEKVIINTNNHNHTVVRVVNKSTYWRNSSGDVIVKINRYYPALDKVIYTKYSRTGRPLKVCSTYYSTFLWNYTETTEDYGF